MARPGVFQTRATKADRQGHPTKQAPLRRWICKERREVDSNCFIILNNKRESARPPPTGAVANRSSAESNSAHSIFGCAPIILVTLHVHEAATTLLLALSNRRMRIRRRRRRRCPSPR